MSSAGQQSKPWRDEDELRRLYWGERLSQKEVGEKLGCNHATVSYWMEKFDIPSRERIEAAREARRVEWAVYSINIHGYGVWRDRTVREEVGVHQLLAISDGADPHEVFEEGTHCHHTTHHPLDNRPGIVEVMEAGEHLSYHNQQKVPEWKRELIQWNERVNSAAETTW